MTKEAEKLSEARDFRNLHLGGNGNLRTLTAFAIDEMMQAYAEHKNRELKEQYEPVIVVLTENIELIETMLSNNIGRGRVLGKMLLHNLLFRNRLTLKNLEQALKETKQ